MDTFAISLVLVGVSPKARTWIQVVYLRGDPRKHGEKVGEGESWWRKAVLMSEWPLWATGAPSHWRPSEESCQMCLKGKGAGGTDPLSPNLIG